MKDRDFWLGRLARYPLASGGGRPRIWFHASSVGEVTGALATVARVKERFPCADLTVTVGTPQGFRFASKHLGTWARALPFALDLPGLIGRQIKQLRPDLYVGFESEYWPLLFRYLRRREVPAVLFNGRLSDRSARLYLRFSPLFRPVFEHFNWLAVNTARDRDNVLSLGAKPDRVLVLGSSKYETLVIRTGLGMSRDWPAILNLEDASTVLVGGSLRKRECDWLIDISRQLKELEPSLVALLVPRHLSRIDDMKSHLRRKGEPFELLSDLIECRRRRCHGIVLVNSIGVLFELYALGDLVFCGGTLEPIGGHNIVEPVVWGKTVYYGPYVDKVAREHGVLSQHGMGIMVPNHDALKRMWMDALAIPRNRAVGAGDGIAVIESLGGVVDEQLRLIELTLQETETKPAKDAS